MTKCRNRLGRLKSIALMFALCAATQLMHTTTAATAAEISAPSATTTRVAQAASASPTGYSLTTYIIGGGSIHNVDQYSPPFVCASPSTKCSVTAGAGTSFDLQATPSDLYDFAGWYGADCSFDSCLPTLYDNTTVTAIFTPQQLLQRDGSATPYLSLSTAYKDSSDGSEIRSRDAIINGDVKFDRPIGVALSGGYADDSFTDVSGFTTIQGAFAVQRGSVTASNVKVGLKAVAAFTLAQPKPVTVFNGGTGTSIVSTTVSGGFNSAVDLRASGLPFGAVATFSPASIPAPGSGVTTLTLSAGASTPPGSYLITVTGTGGGETHAWPLMFTVFDPTMAGFAGSYTGTFTGSDSGTIEIDVAADGSISGTATSTADPSYYFTIVGSVTASGQANVQGYGSAGSVTLAGTVTAQGGLAGTWSGITRPGSGGGSGTFTTQTITKDVQRDETVKIRGLNLRGQGTLVLGNSVGDTLTITLDGTYTFATPFTDAARWVFVISQPEGQICAVTRKRVDQFNPYTEELTSPLTSDFYCYQWLCGSAVSLGEAPAPIGLTVKSFTDTTVELEWERKPWEYTYRFYYGNDLPVVANNPVSHLVDYQYKTLTFSTPTVIYNLEPDTDYYFALTATYNNPANLYGCQTSATPPVRVRTAKTGPVISSIFPLSGSPGTVVTITGANFSSTTYSNTVMFNGKFAIVKTATDKSLTVEVPYGATTGTVTVKTGGVTNTSKAIFTVVAAIDHIGISDGQGTGFRYTPGQSLQLELYSYTLDLSTYTYIPSRITSGITWHTSGERGVSISPSGVVQTDSDLYAPFGVLAGYATYTYNGQEYRSWDYIVYTK